MGHPSRSRKDSGTEDDVGCKGPAQEISEGKNTGKWARDRSSDILMRNVAALCHCPKSAKGKLKSFGIDGIRRGDLRHPSIDPVVWLLMVSLMQIYNEKEKAEEGKIKMNRLRRKGVPGNVMKLSPVFKEIKEKSKEKA